jgi:hypothetical protein
LILTAIDLRCHLYFTLNNLFSYFIILQHELGVRSSFDQINFMMLLIRLCLIYLISKVIHFLSVYFTIQIWLRSFQNRAVCGFPDLARTSQLFFKPVLLNADELIVYIVLGNFLGVLLQAWRSRSSFVLTLFILWKTLTSLICQGVTKYMF